MGGGDQPISSKPIGLIRSRRFLPLFTVQFLGAFNDNFLKTVFVVLIAYGLWDIGGWSPAVLVAVAAGVFILPFVMFCPLAGNLSDKYDKALLIRRIKFAEIIIAALGVWALFSGSIIFALFVLLLLGAQSAFFTPNKFSILPQHLRADELIIGNAWVSMGAYLAILAGTILGAVLAPMEGGKVFVALGVMGIALIGYVASRFIPDAPPPAPHLKISYNIFAKAVGVTGHALAQKPAVVISILGTAWFYFVAATIHSQFPNFTKASLGADTSVLVVFMTIFSVGIALGGFLNHRLLRAKIHGRFVPIACMCMAVFGVDLFFAARAYPTPVDGEALLDFAGFISNVHGVRLFADTFLLAVACGFFVVPLRAIVQHRAQEDVRSRVISGSNMMEALFILMSSVFAMIVLGAGVSIEGLYLCVSVMTLIVGLALFRSQSIRGAGM